jgi:hypothetical protein
MDKNYLFDWVFHYNNETEQWAAIPRELYNQYWNNYSIEGIIRSSSHATLLEIIQKTNGKGIEKKLNLD